MVDKKITDLVAKTSPQATDLLLITDMNDGGGIPLSKKITYQNLMSLQVVDVLTKYGNGTSYTKATIDAAYAAEGGSLCLFTFRPGTWVINANADYSAYPLVFCDIPPGAKFSFGAYNLTLSNTPIAGRYQIFVGTGAVGGIRFAYPEWFDATGGVNYYQAIEQIKLSFPDVVTGFKRGIIYLDAATYPIATGVQIPNNISVEGLGWWSIISSEITTGVCIDRVQTTWAAELARRSGWLKNFRLTSASGLGSGLRIASGGHLEDEGLMIDGFTEVGKYGMGFGGGPVVEYTSKKIYLYGNYDNLQIPPGASITTATFKALSSRGAIRYGVLVDNGTGITFDSECVYESNGSSGFKALTSTQTIINLKLLGGYFENNNTTVAGKQCSIIGLATAYIYNPILLGVHFSTPGAAGTGSLELDYTRQLMGTGNKFPQVVAPNYDVWDLGHNVGPLWIGNDPLATLSGFGDIASLTGIIAPGYNGLVIGGGANAFNLTKGTANLDVAEAKTVNVDESLDFQKGLTITTNTGTLKFGSAGVVFNADQSLVASRLVNVDNLKLVVNAAVNKLDLFTVSGGAVPDATNFISVAIPNGNGVTFRTRPGPYLSGTSQFVLDDASNYWGKVSDAAQFRNAYIYAIWDGSGIVWALGGYSGFKMTPTTTTGTDDDFFLLEASSTYTRNAAHYCVCVGRIRYSYNVSNTPDHTIQATVEDSPELIYNPKSDYGYTKNLAARILGSGADIAEVSVVNLVVKQSGKYSIMGTINGGSNAASQDTFIGAYLKVGSATYGSAIYKREALSVVYFVAGNTGQPVPVETTVCLNAGDTIHLGGYVSTAGATAVRTIQGDDASPNGTTHLTFRVVD